MTASFIEEDDKNAKEWNLRTATLAFRKIEGIHNADTFGDILFDVVQDYGIVHTVRST